MFIAGWATGADAPARVWIGTALIAWLGSGLFALFGLAVAQTFKSESSVSIASAALVVFAFLGNLFVPLSGTMLQIARFTPMYGYAGLARWPQLEGVTIAGNGLGPEDSLAMLILNVVLWAALFGVIAAWAVQRGRRRQ